MRFYIYQIIGLILIIPGIGIGISGCGDTSDISVLIDENVNEDYYSLSTDESGNTVIEVEKDIAHFAMLFPPGFTLTEIERDEISTFGKIDIWFHKKAEQYRYGSYIIINVVDYNGFMTAADIYNYAWDSAEGDGAAVLGDYTQTTVISGIGGYHLSYFNVVYPGITIPEIPQPTEPIDREIRLHHTACFDHDGYTYVIELETPYCQGPEHEKIFLDVVDSFALIE